MPTPRKNAPTGRLARGPKAPSLSVLLAIACFLSLVPTGRALATMGSPLAARLVELLTLAGPNDGNPEPQRTPSTPIGTLPSSFHVDDGGAARYSIPLAVPPAARGVQPSLALEYDSQLGDGPLGVGWQLSGQSAISRCGLTLAEDGEVAPVRMNDADALCLDGRRLMLVEGEPFELGATYRPKRDDFTRVRVVADGGHSMYACEGGYAFEARRRDGSIATYGCREDATVSNHLGAHTWSLGRERDRFGNYIDYRYGSELEVVVDGEGDVLGQVDVEHRLLTIEYGGHLDAHPTTRSVRLIWEDRPDPSTGFAHGAPILQTQRLAELATYGPEGLVHRYELDYDTPSITGRSLLHAVRQCDAEGVCRPETSFEWELGEHGFDNLETGNNFELMYWPYMSKDGDPILASPKVVTHTILDANGDGRTDMFMGVGESDYPAPEGRGWETWTSQPGTIGNLAGTSVCGTSDDNLEQCVEQGFYIVEESARTGWLPGDPWQGLGHAVPPAFAADYDGDGRDDVYALGGSENNLELVPAGYEIYIARSLAEGGVDQFEFNPGVGLIWQFSGADQTGDGLGDLLMCAGEPGGVDVGRWYFVANVPGEGFSAADVVDTGLDCSLYDKLLHLDHDGDGLSSLATIPVRDVEQDAWIPSSQWGNYQILHIDPTDGSGSLEDVGLPPDLAQRWRPALAGSGNYFNADEDFPKSLQGFGIDRILDVNGDGLADVLRYELDSGDDADNLGVIINTVAVEDPVLEEWGGIRLWLNTGAGFVDGGWVAQASKPGDRFFRAFLGSGVLDYDGDGRLDYLTPVDDPNSDHWDWEIWTTKGDGSFAKGPAGFDIDVWDMSVNTRTMSAFDLDGDAMHDVGVILSWYWDLYSRRGEVPDKIVGIENGLGARVELEYASIRDHEAPEGLHELDVDDCVYPERCERDPQIVVARHFVDSGVTGEPRSFEHRYGMARSDRLGRRGLGFSWHETVELAEVDGGLEPVYRRKVSYARGYDTGVADFPRAGLPTSELEDVRDPLTGRHRVSYTGRSYKYLETSAQTYHPYVTQQVSRTHELEACAETFCDPLEFDDGTELTEIVDTVFELDAFGNPTQWSSSTDTGKAGLVKYRHDAAYENDPDSWLLGLQSFERVTFIQPGVSTREREWTASYHDTGAVKAEVLEPGDPELFLHTSYDYDAHGNRTGRFAVDADGEQRGSTTTFDEHGVFPLVSKNALGQASTMRWDPGLGVPVEAADPNGLRMIADYDGLGHVTGLRTFAGDLPQGDGTTFSYLDVPQFQDGPVLEVRSETAGHGHASVRFDRLGRVVHEAELALDGEDRYVATRYDHFGRVAEVSLPTREGVAPQGWDLYAYDFADRLAKHTLPDGTVETWHHAGLEAEHVDIGGTVNRLRLDAGLRLVESVRGLGTPDEERMCFDYGGFEQLVRARPDCVEHGALAYDAGEAPPTIKSFVYDDLAQLIASHDPSEGSRSYVYNGHGELERYVDGKGQETVLERDLLGRVHTRVDNDGLTSWTWDTDFIGAPTSSVSADGHEEHLDYDAFGRVRTLTKIIHGEVFDLEFGYDDYGRLEQIHYPLAEQQAPFWIRNIRAQNGQLAEVRGDLDDALLWRAEELDGLGNVTVERFGNQALTERSFDPLRGFTLSIETTALGGTLQDLRYEWNDDGTLQERADGLHTQAESFGYDALHRLIESHTSKGQTQHDRYFAYDGLGNLVFATDRGEYSYDGDGRLAFADGHSFEWDENGNLLARIGDSETTLSYTAFDKPREIVEDGLATSFEYDAEQRRVYRYSEAEARETVYVTDLYQRHHSDETGETQHHYYVPGLERMVATVVDTVGPVQSERRTHYVHVDHLGSTDVVSDGAGLIEKRLAFDAWGKRRDPSDWTLPEEFAELGPVNLGYTGHEAQEDGGLINMRGRMYDPHLGRMASADPLVVDPTSTQGWNRYAYVLNRPLVFTDPSGFEPDSGSSDSGGGGGGGEGGETGETGGSSSGISHGASGVIGTGQATQTTPDTSKNGGSSTPKPDAGASQQAGDRGPSASSAIAGGVKGGLTYVVGRLGENTPSDPTLRFANAMVRDENPSQERRRLNQAAKTEAQAVENMQNPPTYVVVSVEVTLFILGGDLELAGGAVRFVVQGGARKTATRKLAEEGVEEGGDLLVAAGKRKAKRGDAASRAKEIHEAVPPATRRRTTIAVTETEEGVRVVSSSEPQLRRAQRAKLGPGEVEAKGPGHAEVTGINGAREMGLTPTGTAASRPICSNCARTLDSEGVSALSPRK